MVRFLISLLVLFFIACQNKPIDKTTETDSSATLYIPDAVDSIDLLYFKKPYTDSLRYQRFFTYLQSGDSTLIQALRENLNQPFQEFVGPVNCLSEGKIIIPHGGDAFRIVYFSRTEAPCSYLYVIDNGRFRYYPLTEKVKAKLYQWEGLAVEPK
jgi:hypothetical protein